MGCSRSADRGVRPWYEKGACGTRGWSCRRLLADPRTGKWQEPPWCGARRWLRVAAAPTVVLIVQTRGQLRGGAASPTIRALPRREPQDLGGRRARRSSRQLAGAAEHLVGVDAGDEATVERYAGAGGRWAAGLPGYCRQLGAVPGPLAKAPEAVVEDHMSVTSITENVGTRALVAQGQLPGRAQWRGLRCDATGAGGQAYRGRPQRADLRHAAAVGDAAAARQEPESQHNHGRHQGRPR
jgi:hypothetical protein